MCHLTAQSQARYDRPTAIIRPMAAISPTATAYQAECDHLELFETPQSFGMVLWKREAVVVSTRSNWSNTPKVRPPLLYKRTPFLLRLGFPIPSSTRPLSTEL
jgi:hypothetical protein